MLTYLLFIASWAALALGLLAPWIVEWLTTPAFYDASDVVALLAFGAVAFGGFIVVSIGLGRTKRTQFNWVATGSAAVVSVTLNLLLIPRHGIVGAAIANVCAFTVMFVGITWWSQRVFWVPYQWRRVVTVIGSRGRPDRARQGARRAARGAPSRSSRCIRSCCGRSASTCRTSSRRSGGEWLEPRREVPQRRRLPRDPVAA